VTLKSDTVKAAQSNIYKSLHAAIRRDSLPVDVRFFRGGVVAVGDRSLVAALDANTAATRLALDVRVTALKALASVVAGWNIYDGISATSGAPESYSCQPRITPSLWRNEQPYETDMRIYNVPLDQIAEAWKNRARWVPSAAEVDAMQIPGV